MTADAALYVSRMPGPFGAFVDGAGASLLEAGTLGLITDALCEHRIIVVRDVAPTAAEYVAFGRHFGEPIAFFNERSRDREHPELIEIHNRPSTPAALRDGAMHWHQDSSYESPAASITMLCAAEAPAAGNDTLFADVTAAYDALPATTRARIADLVVQHDPLGGRVALDGEKRGGERKPGMTAPLVEHRLVLPHPVTGRLALYGVSGTAAGIAGMDDDEAIALLIELKQHALQPQFRQTARATTGSILIWDNFAVMHSATPTEYSDEPGHRRRLHRISIRA